MMAWQSLEPIRVSFTSNNVREWILVSFTLDQQTLTKNNHPQHTKHRSPPQRCIAEQQNNKEWGSLSLSNLSNAQRESSMPRLLEKGATVLQY